MQKINDIYNEEIKYLKDAIKHASNPFHTFSLSTLKKSYYNARHPYLKEHVTPYMHGKAAKSIRVGSFNVQQFLYKKDYSSYRITLDRKEDLNLIREIYSQLNDFCSWKEVIKLIEKKLGRKKTLINRPRICDIDIIDYGGQIYKLSDNNNKLTIPHPRLHNRNFVLFPLFEIEKNWKHPSKKTKIHDLIRKLDNSSLYSIKQI